MQVRLLAGDCIERLLDLENNSIDAIVTDPPYELGFMGKAWDSSGVSFDWKTWATVLWKLKPGGHLLSFAGTRTYHRIACAIEDAGFEIRDQLQWLYGSGFPKGRDISKAIDKRLGAEREVIGIFPHYCPGRKVDNFGVGEEGFTDQRDRSITAPATEEAQQWEGWGTQLKPAHEPIVLARKPFTGTVENNILQYGTGGININGCRIPTTDANYFKTNSEPSAHAGPVDFMGDRSIKRGGGDEGGRWPANVILDEEAGVVLDEQSGHSQSTDRVRHNNQSRTSGQGIYGKFNDQDTNGYADSGGASRFFYCAKASKAERNAGCDELEAHTAGVGALRDGGRESQPRKNDHPTVKPLALMRYLVRLVTPPGGIILDPFMGSGSTGCAAVLEGFSFVGIDNDPHSVEIAEARIAYWKGTV